MLDCLFCGGNITTRNFKPSVFSYCVVSIVVRRTLYPFFFYNEPKHSQTKSRQRNQLLLSVRTPSTSGSSTSRISSDSRCSASVESTPLSSRETMQKLIAGLSACQKSMEEVIKKVQSSIDRIEELADKVKALDDKVSQ